MLRPGWPGPGAAAEPGQQGEAVATVAECGRVLPRTARVGSAARSMPGSNPVARRGGCWPPWASMSTRIRPEGPAATPGTAAGSWRHQAEIRARSVVAARTPWHQPSAARQGQVSAWWPRLPCQVLQAAQLPRGRLLAGDSGRMCQPSAASSSASRAGALMVGMDVLRGCLAGAGDAYRSPAAGPQLAPGGAQTPTSPRPGGRGVGIPRRPATGRRGGDGQVRNGPG